uniref:RRM domain-containing protein n=1 Tax=Catharus ustulatus TaxID=91951 RepID=A0A8C3UEY3_CATUS
MRGARHSCPPPTGKAGLGAAAAHTSGLLRLMTTTADQLLEFFKQVGEVKFVRMAGDETQPTRFAFVEFADQNSVPRALAFNGVMFGDRPLKFVCVTVHTFMTYVLLLKIGKISKILCILGIDECYKSVVWLNFDIFKRT